LTAKPRFASLMSGAGKAVKSYTYLLAHGSGRADDLTVAMRSVPEDQRRCIGGQV